MSCLQMTLTFSHGRDPVELFGRLNAGLGVLNRWFRCNRLTLNLKKTEYIYFTGPSGQAEPPEGLEIGGGTGKEGISLGSG